MTGEGHPSQRDLFREDVLRQTGICALRYEAFHGLIRSADVAFAHLFFSLPLTKRCDRMTIDLGQFRRSCVTELSFVRGTGESACPPIDSPLPNPMRVTMVTKWFIALYNLIPTT